MDTFIFEVFRYTQVEWNKKENKWFVEIPGGEGQTTIHAYCKSVSSDIHLECFLGGRWSVHLEGNPYLIVINNTEERLKLTDEIEKIVCESIHFANPPKLLMTQISRIAALVEQTHPILTESDKVIIYDARENLSKEKIDMKIFMELIKIINKFHKGDSLPH